MFGFSEGGKPRRRLWRVVRPLEETGERLAALSADRMIGSWGLRPIIGSHLRFHSSRECMRKRLGLGGHLFSARNIASASSVFTALEGWAAKGYVEIPLVERANMGQLYS